MSSALAIAGVTALLRDRLNDGAINHDVSSKTGKTVKVSVLPPDRVATPSGSESDQLNLFLYQVTPNPGWRNEGLPSMDASGHQRLSNPPLALDLHYLVSAYADDDLNAEILLGYAMQLLHQFPVITRKVIRTALDQSRAAGAVLPPKLLALADCGLADQLELLKITPQTLNLDDLSKLWSATQSSIRPSVSYLVSVVLIQGEQPARSPLPVLSRGMIDPDSGRDSGVIVEPSLIPPLPMIETVVPVSQQPVIRLGESITLSGHYLDGSKRQVRLINDRLDINEILSVEAGNAAGEIKFSIPADRATDFPVGLYEVSALIERPDGAKTKELETNRLALVLAPWIAGLPTKVSLDLTGTARFTLMFQPHLRAGQRVSLLLGQAEVAPTAFPTPAASLNFVIPDAPVGNHLVRLRIDGIDSPIIDRAAKPPVFLDQRIKIE